MTAQPSLAQDALLLSVGVKGLTRTHSWMNAKCWRSLPICCLSLIQCRDTCHYMALTEPVVDTNLTLLKRAERQSQV